MWSSCWRRPPLCPCRSPALPPSMAARYLLRLLYTYDPCPGHLILALLELLRCTWVDMAPCTLWAVHGILNSQSLLNIVSMWSRRVQACEQGVLSDCALRRLWDALQAALSGGATFVTGLGRSGLACFSMTPAAAPGTDWQTLAAEDADLRVAAEVVVGRSDLQDLTALGMPRVDAAEVSTPTLTAELLRMQDMPDMPMSDCLKRLM